MVLTPSSGGGAKIHLGFCFVCFWGFVVLRRFTSYLSLLSGCLGRNRSSWGSRLLVDEGLVDVGDNSTTSDSGLDHCVKLLITTNGKKKMPGGDTLHLQVLTGVSSKLEHLSGEVLHDGGSVNGGGSTNTLKRVHTSLQESVNTTDGKLKTSSRGS